MRLEIDEKKTRTALPRIMQAAVRLFTQKGIEGTTIKDIAGKAGVAEGALYRHFASKDELASHLFSTNLQRFTERVETRVAAVAGSSAKLRAYVEAIFEEYEAEPDLFYFLILAEHRELAPGAAGNHPGKLLEGIIRKGQAAGEIRRGSYWVLVSLCVGALHRICILRHVGVAEGPLPAQSDEMHALLWRALEA